MTLTKAASEPKETGSNSSYGDLNVIPSNLFSLQFYITCNSTS